MASTWCGLDSLLVYFKAFVTFRTPVLATAQGNKTLLVDVFRSLLTLFCYAVFQLGGFRHNFRRTRTAPEHASTVWTDLPKSMYSCNPWEYNSCHPWPVELESNLFPLLTDAITCNMISLLVFGFSVLHRITSWAEQSKLPFEPPGQWRLNLSRPEEPRVPIFLYRWFALSRCFVWISEFPSKLYKLIIYHEVCRELSKVH